MSREMKDSGVEWIGEIPKNWSIVPVKAVFKSKKTIVGSLEKDFQRLALTLDGVIPREKIDSNGLQPANFETYQIVRKKDLIFKLIDLENIKTSRVGLSEYEGIVSPVYIRLVNERASEYGFWYFYDLWNQNVFNVLGSGVRSNLTSKDLLNLPFIENNNSMGIVRKIKKEVKVINSIVAKTKQSIEELKKYKQSLITEVVTKGLDKNVEMKDSGIEWIGGIPKDWETIKGKYLFKKMQREIEVNEIVTAFRDGQVVQRKKRRTDGFTNSLQEHGYQGIRKGDLVIHSMDAFAGAIGVSEDDGKSTPVYIVLDSVKPNLNHEYFSYLMRTYSILGYIESMAKGIRVRSTDFKYDTFANTLLINPPIAEQIKIVEYINRKQKNIDELINKKIELINEYESYKKSLIYEYVTGKKEVGEEVK